MQEIPDTACLIDSDAFDLEGNLVVNEGDQVEVRVYNCGLELAGRDTYGLQIDPLSDVAPALIRLGGAAAAPFLLSSAEPRTF